MKSTENYLTEIKEIRKLMEESSRFLSLSGLSGILVGIYALIGSFIAFNLLSNRELSSAFLEDNIKLQIILLSVAVLVFSIITIIVLTHRKAKKAGKKFWNAGSRMMMINLAVPLISGGILIVVFISREYFDLVLPASLLFYGLALVNAAKFTRQEIFFMGLFEILLGLLAAIFTSYGLLIWALGFGVLHIVYGTLMYFRYEYHSNV